MSALVINSPSGNCGHGVSSFRFTWANHASNFTSNPGRVMGPSGITRGRVATVVAGSVLKVVSSVVGDVLTGSDISGVAVVVVVSISVVAAAAVITVAAAVVIVSVGNNVVVAGAFAAVVVVSVVVVFVGICVVTAVVGISVVKAADAVVVCGRSVDINVLISRPREEINWWVI